MDTPEFGWMGRLDDRTRKHVLYAKVYARDFAHGAPGHLDLMTIAELAKLLDSFERHASQPPKAREWEAE